MYRWRGVGDKEAYLRYLRRTGTQYVPKKYLAKKKPIALLKYLKVLIKK